MALFMSSFTNQLQTYFVKDARTLLMNHTISNVPQNCIANSAFLLSVLTAIKPVEVFKITEVIIGFSQ